MSVKNGIHHGRQRFKCKDCGCQFTTEKPRGISPAKKHVAAILYTCGLSYRAIAGILKVSHKAVYDWIGTFSLSERTKLIRQGNIKHGIAPQPGCHFVVMQIDSSNGEITNIDIIL